MIASCRRDYSCEDGVCTEKHANGEACSDDISCEHSACDQTTHVCGHPDGSTCNWEGECASELCIEGICGSYNFV